MLAIKKLKPAMSTAALLLALWPRVVRSQSCCQDSQLELLRAQLMSAEFRQLQTEYRAWQNLERRSVPVYNARLKRRRHCLPQAHHKGQPLPEYKLWILQKISGANQAVLEEASPSNEVSEGSTSSAFRFCEERRGARRLLVSLGSRSIAPCS